MRKMAAAKVIVLLCSTRTPVEARKNARAGRWCPRGSVAERQVGVESGQLEHPLDRRRAAPHAQAIAPSAGLLLDFEQQADPRGIDEFEPAEVEEHVVGVPGQDP